MRKERRDRAEDHEYEYNMMSDADVERRREEKRRGGRRRRGRMDALVCYRLALRW